MDKSKKLEIIAAACAMACVVFLYLHAISDNSAYVEPPAPTPAVSDVASESESETEPTEPAETDDGVIDFEALQAQNMDIYAWIDIPGTDISYPVCNRAGDNAYYLDHDLDGKPSEEGTLFTEDYNNTSFTDPATAIYGHNMASGTMFGSLQEDYSNPDFFHQNQTITITLPEGEKNYKIFAAVPYSNAHLLANYDFSTSQGFMAFLDSVYSVRSLEAVIDTSISVGSRDRILILSTCLHGNHDERFLVIGVEMTE